MADFDFIRVGDTVPASVTDAVPAPILPSLQLNPEVQAAAPVEEAAAVDALPPDDLQAAVAALLDESGAATATDTGIYATCTNLYDRPFLSTPLKDYTVTEGLLLLIFLILAFRMIFHIWNN